MEVEGGKMAMVVGVDESDHSYYTLQWTLQHSFPPDQPKQEYRLVVVTAKPVSTPVELGGPAVVFGEPDMPNKTAVRVIDKAKELYEAHQVRHAEFDVVEGDTSKVMCDAVQRHNVEMLAVGSHGYGTLKRFVLGSISDYCARNADCTVIIVKKPKDDIRAA